MIRQFFNVLYRRILYKIPLKLLLVILAIVSVFIACTKADSINTIEVSPFAVWDKSVAGNSTYTTVNAVGDILCVQSHSSSCNSVTVTFQNGDTFSGNPYFGDDLQDQSILCGVGGAGEFSVRNNNNSSCTYYLLRFTWSEVVSSTMCQTEYNLIPISSVDSNYCTTNNLCPSQECPVCPVGSGSISTLYINDILHVGAPFIYFDIPQEISWDYTYTQGGTNMLIEVEGYNVDYEKIDNIVNTQSYTPNESDLSSIITDIVPLFVPGLVIILFLYFLFRFIKKIF